MRWLRKPRLGVVSKQHSPVSVRGWLRELRWMLTWASVLGLVGSSATIISPLVARSMVESMVGKGGVEAVPPVLAILLLISLVILGAVANGLQAMWLERSGERVVYRIRMRFVNHVLRAHFSDLDRWVPAQIISRLSVDTTLVQRVVTSACVGAINAILSLIAVVVLMATIDVPLLGVVAVSVVFLVAVNVLIAPRIASATHSAQQSMGDFGGALERTLIGLRTVRASNATTREVSAVREAAHEVCAQGLRNANYNAILGAVSNLSVQFAFVAVLLAGATRVNSGALTVGDLIAFVLYVFYLSHPANLLVKATADVQRGRVAMGRLGDMGRMAAEDVSAGNAVAENHPTRSAVAAARGYVKLQHRDVESHGSGRPAVSFRDVSFQYPRGSRQILGDVSFDVPERSITVLVGGSGTGKTTLFSLLQRFYEPTGGQILFRGVDIARIDRTTLRGQLSYVEQEAPVLSGSIHDNLVFGSPNASPADVWSAVHAARLAEVIEDLPDGLHTTVGFRGVALSGGQRQRVAIARALIRRSPVLLLDEPTGQLDGVNESAIMRMLEIARHTTAVLMISHSISVMRRADRIAVLNGGGIEAVGTHDVLIRGSDTYNKLVGHSAGSRSRVASTVPQE